MVIKTKDEPNHTLTIFSLMLISEDSGKNMGSTKCLEIKNFFMYNAF